NETLRARNITELVESIRGTKFYGILKPLILEENKIDLFSAEMALDMYYYNRLIGQLKPSMQDKEGEILRKLFGAEADLKNILWIYRGKKYYNINKDILNRYLIPLSDKLQKEELNKLVEANDDVEVIELIQNTFYKDVLTGNPKKWEHEFLQYLLKVERKNVRFFPFSLAPVVGYIVLKELEINNIISIIEGIRYSVPSEDIRDQLIGRSL
ncbi:MAG: V-type ATPase subunit, partial [Vallitaleaceae bacterium]|nr:V-type ATPase subunit [Vallitaleaceae bacterium]